MTLDEAIKHCEEVVREQEEDAGKWEYTLGVYRRRDYCEQSTIPACEKALKKCKECATEHRQLAEWLKELKIIHEIIDDMKDSEEIFVGYLRKKTKEKI